MKKHFFKLIFISSLSLIGTLGCLSSESVPTKFPSNTINPKALSGGDTTVIATSKRAFALPLANLQENKQDAFFVGNSLFNLNWVTAPASTTMRDGLGPLFNTRSCSSCHFLDGRGKPPEPGERMFSMLLRLSIPGRGEHGANVPEPNYGGQLNEHAILGVPSEGIGRVSYTEIKGVYGDGTPYSLRKPSYSITDTNYGELHPQTMISPRVANAMIGLGLLDAVPAETILAFADATDENQDGISGRPNYVWNHRTQQKEIGRFGWKANEPNVEQQVAGAFLGDIGITTPIFPNEECTPVQKECATAIHGGTPEVPEEKFQMLVTYSRSIGVPARRKVNDPIVMRGETLFEKANCSACHIPSMKTGAWKEFPELENQDIRPYTDLLLHDMGEGLADHRPDLEATGREWRTAPLWGIGLVEQVNDHTYFLHDGRARNFAEAILWHGGEAEASKEAFRNMNQQDREAVVTFLESL